MTLRIDPRGPLAFEFPFPRTPKEIEELCEQIRKLHISLPPLPPTPSSSNSPRPLQITQEPSPIQIFLRMSPKGSPTLGGARSIIYLRATESPLAAQLEGMKRKLTSPLETQRSIAKKTIRPISPKTKAKKRFFPSDL